MTDRSGIGEGNIGARNILHGTFPQIRVRHGDAKNMKVTQRAYAQIGLGFGRPCWFQE